MEVILLENIKNLGNIGDVVNVKRGHGRNFLIKYGKALKASKENIALVNKKKSELNEKNITLKKNAKKIYDVINKKNYKFLKQTKDNDELYGSIKPKEISTAIMNKMKLEIKPSQIVLKEDLNKLGTYKIELSFHSEVSSQISIKIDKIQSA